MDFSVWKTIEGITALTLIICFSLMAFGKILKLKWMKKAGWYIFNFLLILAGIISIILIFFNDM